MKFSDFSPPKVPTRRQQLDALRKGLGRARQWAARGLLTDRVLRYACLHDQRLDLQCEEERGDWLWELLILSGADERLREEIFKVAATTIELRDAYQLATLACYYAKDGHLEFRQILYEMTNRIEVNGTLRIGEYYLLSLDGPTAFPRLLRQRGAWLAERPWDWDGERFMEIATKAIGRESFQHLLFECTDPDSQRFIEEWRRQIESARKEPFDHSGKSAKDMSVSEILESASQDQSQWTFGRWGAKASEGDLLTILHVLWTVQEPRILANLLAVFSRRPLPQFDSRIFDFCRHPDPEVQRRALSALELNTHSLIREFALSASARSVFGSRLFSLFIRNYLPGDESYFLENYDLPTDVRERHGFLMDLKEILEENPEADRSQLGLICYFESQCTLCRAHAAELLIEHDLAPDWLWEEAKFDCEESLRKLVADDTQEPTE